MTEKATTRIGKNAKGYGYKYTDLASIHEWLEENGLAYYQEIRPEIIDGQIVDYIWTTRIIDGTPENTLRGCRVFAVPVESKSGKPVTNAAQEIGSGITYARRYSLLMAFGLACEDDDAASLTREKHHATRKEEPLAVAISAAQVEELKNLISITGTDERAFLKFYKCARLEALAVTDYAGAVEQLNRKIAKMASPATNDAELPEAMR